LLLQDRGNATQKNEKNVGTRRAAFLSQLRSENGRAVEGKSKIQLRDTSRPYISNKKQSVENEKRNHQIHHPADYQHTHGNRHHAGRDELSDLALDEKPRKTPIHSHASGLTNTIYLP
jgi:hypothetical protein